MIAEHEERIQTKILISEFVFAAASEPGPGTGEPARPPWRWVRVWRLTGDGLRSKGDEQRLTSEGWGATIGVVGTVETKILISEFTFAALKLKIIN